MSEKPSFSFPTAYAGVEIERYNNVIRQKAGALGARVIDLAAQDLVWDTMDGSHPNRRGMEELATHVIRAMLDEDETYFLDCPNREHDFFTKQQLTGCTEYCCRKCGKLVVAHTLPGDKGLLPYAGSSVDGREIPAANKSQGTLRFNNEGETYGSGTILFGRYYLEKEIPMGGLSFAFQADDRKRHLKCVVKGTPRMPVTESLLELECLRHPAIQSVEVFGDDKWIYTVLEVIEGQTLNEYLRDNKSVLWKTAVALAIQLCDALNYLLTREPPFYHHKLTPSQIMLDQSGSIKLLCFGAVTRRQREQNDFLEIPSYDASGYVAPESFGTAFVDERTEIYSMGVLLHQMITGVDPVKPPYELRPIRQVNSELPKRLESIIMKCLQLRPENRYQTVYELRDALCRCLESPVKRFWCKL